METSTTSEEHFGPSNIQLGHLIYNLLPKVPGAPIYTPDTLQVATDVHVTSAAVNALKALLIGQGLITQGDFDRALNLELKACALLLAREHAEKEPTV